MTDDELDLFAFERGSVSAPAGCGKTQLITSALLQAADKRPALVLTHTNAGRTALEQRLKKAEVPSGTARVATLDSWAIRLVQSFPLRSGLVPEVLCLHGNSANYQAIRQGAVRILQGGHANIVIRATYSRVVVDEYQDCSTAQHDMVRELAKLLPTIVLGDPLQVIFDFAGPVVHWRNEVVTTFPSIPWKREPWRWKNAGSPLLGGWLLNVVRPALGRAGGCIDLAAAPEGVVWVPLKGTEAEKSQARLAAAKARFDGTALIIADSRSKEAQWEIARRTRSTMVEANEMVDFINFATAFDPARSASLDQALGFFGNLLVGLASKQLIARARSLQSGRAKVGASEIEEICLKYLRDPSYRAAADMLDSFGQARGVFAFRPDIVRLCSKALRAVNGKTTLREAALRERERFRHMPRIMRPRSVGSTLLLKGLEADVAVVLEPEKMNAQNLYVAMTRGSKKLIICSSSARLCF